MGKMKVRTPSSKSTAKFTPVFFKLLTRFLCLNDRKFFSKIPWRRFKVDWMIFTFLFSSNKWIRKLWVLNVGQKMDEGVKYIKVTYGKFSLSFYRQLKSRSSSFSMVFLGSLMLATSLMFEFYFRQSTLGMITRRRKRWRRSPRTPRRLSWKPSSRRRRPPRWSRPNLKSRQTFKKQLR